MFSILMAIIQITGIFIAIQILTNKVFSIKEGLVTIAIAMLAFPLFTLVQYWSMIFVLIVFVSALYWKNKNVVVSASITLVVIILLTISDSIVGFILVPGLNFKYDEIFNELLPTLIYCAGMLANLLVFSFLLRKLIEKVNISRFVEHRKYAYIIFSIVALTVLAFYMNIYAGSIAGFDGSVLKINTLIFTGYTILLIVIVTVVINTATNELKVQNQIELVSRMPTHQGMGLYFLDIDLGQPDMNGFELAQEIRKFDPRGFIIFITTHAELSYMTFTYKVEALDYIIKDDIDLLHDRVLACMKQAEERISNDQDMQKYFTFKVSDKKIIHELLDDILFFETAPTIHKVILHGKNRQVEFYGKLKNIEKMLDESFYRCHRSYIVNKKNIHELDTTKGVVKMSNGENCYASSKLIKSLSL